MGIIMTKYPPSPPHTLKYEITDSLGCVILHHMTMGLASWVALMAAGTHTQWGTYRLPLSIHDGLQSSKCFNLTSSFFICVSTSKAISDLIFLSSTMARCWGRLEQHYRRCCVWTTVCCNATCQLFKLNLCTI